MAVVGVPDDHWGEQIAALVKPAPGNPVTQDELASWCRARLAAHKTPRHRTFTDAFPLTPAGKSRNSSSESSSPPAQPPRHTNHTTGPPGHNPSAGTGDSTG